MYRRNSCVAYYKNSRYRSSAICILCGCFLAGFASADRPNDQKPPNMIAVYAYAQSISLRYNNLLDLIIRCVESSKTNVPGELAIQLFQPAEHLEQNRR